MGLIRKVVWFELPNAFSISDVIDRVKLYGIEVSSMEVNVYLTRMDRAGLITKQGSKWHKCNSDPNTDFVPHPMLDIFREY